MTHGSLFSGIGGFDLAAEWMGWENIFHCEWNEFGQKVLKHYWPKAISYHDITKTDFTIHRGRIDILTGGFPCQPYSMAGKRKGKEDERHLWPEMLRAIKEIQPRWVVGENVYGLVNWSGGLVFHEVQTDLEAAGYEVFPYVLPAAAVNAPHRRDRIWFVAHRNVANPNGFRLEQCENGTEMGGGQTEMGRQRSEFTNAIETDGTISDAPHPTSSGREQSNKEMARRSSEQFNSSCFQQNDSDPISLRLQGSEQFGSIGTQGTEPGNKQPFRPFCSKWEVFPTQSPICTGDDGLSTRLDGITFSKWRNESIKAAGNAIVPQVALQIFKTIEQYEALPRMAATL